MDFNPAPAWKKRQLHQTKLHKTSSYQEGLGSHSYDSGRWLRSEKQDLALRFIDFDLDALCPKVLELSGKQDLLNCEKIEGCSNRAFIFTFNDNLRLVAKLPFRVAGPAKLTTASEIACIKCLGTCPFKYRRTCPLAPILT
jgi:hypothetical protein